MRFGIDGNRRAKFPREIKLSVVDVDSGNVKPHCLGILHRHMAETTDTGDHNPVTGFGIRYLQTLVDRHASTENRRDFVEINVLRQVTNKIRIGDDIFGKATIDRIACIKLLFAECFPAAQAMTTVATCGIKPWNADAVAFLNVFDTATDSRNITDAFMPRNEWRVGLYRPVAFGCMQIGMANAGRMDGNLYLSRSGLGYRHFVDCQWLSECAHHSGFHCLCHEVSPSLSN